MSQKNAILSGFRTANMIVDAYLSDLDDADLMTRPHPESNHINWQVGHLIASDHQMISQVAPEEIDDLPEGFVKKYEKETQGCDDPAAFENKETLLRLVASQRAAFERALESVEESDFEKPAPEEMQSYCPTVLDLFCMIPTHWTMHSGQWVIVRRMKGKPITI